VFVTTKGHERLRRLRKVPFMKGYKWKPFVRLHEHLSPIMNTKFLSWTLPEILTWSTRVVSIHWFFINLPRISKKKGQKGPRKSTKGYEKAQKVTKSYERLRKVLSIFSWKKNFVFVRRSPNVCVLSRTILFLTNEVPG
jgi:hypothetical protein